MSKEKVFTDFYEAYNFLYTHEHFEGKYWCCVDVDVVKVDPVTKRVEDDSIRNTETRVWFEAGPPGCHNMFLNCGGETYEEATIKLANLVYQRYGDKKARNVSRDVLLIVDEEDERNILEKSFVDETE